MIADVVKEVLVWVLLYFPPSNVEYQKISQALPIYVSAWSSQTDCDKKAGKLNEFMWGKPEGGEFAKFACVREALRDTAKEDGGSYE